MSENQMTTLLAKYSLLENVRPIYDFINTLDKRCFLHSSAYYNGIGSLTKRFRLVGSISRRIGSILDQCFEGESPQPLYQNPLANYIEFWNQYFPDDTIAPTNNDANALLAEMVNYLRCINRLGEREKRKIEINGFKMDDLPYIYEDICLSINKAAKCTNTSFLFSKDNSRAFILARSGERVIDSSKHILDVFSRFILEDDSTSPVNHVRKIIDGIHTYEDADNHFIILSMPLFDTSDESQPIFYIFLEYPDALSDEKSILRIASRILFMQERLLYNIQKDYATLLHFRNDYGYIKTVQPRATQSIKILHLSDFHVTLNKRWDTDSENVKRILATISASGKNYDLLAVTGDIVQASSNAKEAQEKYKMAKKLLFQIAKQLWGFPANKKTPINDRLLPNDWKKRVVIISGNHDYAAMNDVIVKTKSRVTRSAEPADSNAGTMSKFTYLLEFLQSFLDRPISYLIDNNLNEFRNYRNLRLNVVALNTISPANSLQNNKVGLSKEHMKKTCRQMQASGYPNLVLAHHAPIYEIDYMSDIYSPYLLFPTSSANKDTITMQVYNAFCEVVKSAEGGGIFDTDSVDKLNSLFKDLQDHIDIFQKSEEIPVDRSFTSALNAYYHLDDDKDLSADHIKDWITKFCESDLYQDIKHFVAYHKGVKNEFSARLFHKLYSISQMQKVDNESLVNSYQKLLFHGSRITAVLAGHEHVFKEADYGNPSGTEKIPVRIIGKLEDEVGSLMIDLDSGDIRYNASPIEQKKPQ